MKHNNKSIISILILTVLLLISILFNIVGSYDENAPVKRIIYNQPLASKLFLSCLDKIKLDIPEGMLNLENVEPFTGRHLVLNCRSVSIEISTCKESNSNLCILEKTDEQ
jgi:hypothetical protein